MKQIAADLAAEHEALDAVVAALETDEWALPTPSPRWTIADQIGHLGYFDEAATTAITTPDRFGALFEELWTVGLDGGDEALDEFTLCWARDLQPSELLEEWRRRRRDLLVAAETLDDDARVPWFGPSMGAKSFLTARLMETWAHGQDIVDTVQAHRPPTTRLRHVARLGAITRGWTYANRGEDEPTATIRIELTEPGGELFIWGPEDAEERITGDIEEFCLVVTQRRHLADTRLHASGPAGRDWLLKAQVFAGPPTDGPAPGSR